MKNNDLIVGILQAEVRKRTTADWMAALEAEGIPAGPVLHHDEVFADPQILARGMVAEVEHAKAGKQKTLGVPLKMSATPGGVRRAALGRSASTTTRSRSREPRGEAMVRAEGVLAALALMPACGAGAERLQLHRRRQLGGALRRGAGQAGDELRRRRQASPRPRPPSCRPARCRRPTACPSIAASTGLIQPEIRFELNLPANWNRRFYMHGNGGFAGETPEFGSRPMLSRQCAEAGLRHGPDQHRPRRRGRAARQLRR